MQNSIPPYILESIKAFQPETALTLTFCVALVLDLLVKRNRTLTAWVVLAGLAVACIFVSRQSTAAASSIFSGMYAVDGFSIFFKYVILTASVLIVLFSLMSNELNLGNR